jgi:hypothetical protein
MLFLFDKSVIIFYILKNGKFGGMDMAMDEKVIEKNMAAALGIAQRAWKKAGMNTQYEDSEQTGIAIIAAKIFEYMQGN